MALYLGVFVGRAGLGRGISRPSLTLETHAKLNFVDYVGLFEKLCAFLENVLPN